MAEQLPIDPKLLSKISDEEGRDEISRELADRFSAWEDYLEPMDGRWTNIEKMIRNDPEGPRDAFWNGFVYRHRPILSAKARAWQAYVSSAPTSANPYFVGTLFGVDTTRANEVEQDFYLFMRKAHWDRTFKMNILNCGMYGKAFWRVRVDEDESGKPCFRFEAISVRRSFFYPNTEGGIETKLNAGHHYEELIGTIWDMQDQGFYYYDSRPTADSENLSHKEAPGLIDDSQPISKGERTKPKRVVECFDKRDYGQGEKWYRVRFIPDGKPMLLAVYDYPVEYGRPWYFDMWIHEEQGRFIPETSRLNDIQDLQLAGNEVWNLMSAGMQMGAFPTTFMSGGMDQKYRRVRPGSVVPISGGGQVSSLQTRFDPSVMPLLLQDIDQQTDLMMRLGQQSQGGEATNDKTATAAQIRKLGTDTAVNDDLANIDVCMGEIAAYMQKCYLYHFQDFQTAYPGALSVQSPDTLSAEIMWELNGKSPANTPQAQAEAAIGLAQTLTVFNPEMYMFLTQMGINVQELIQTTVKNSILDNREKIILKPDEIAQTLGNPGIAAPMATDAGMGMATDPMAGGGGSLA